MSTIQETVEQALGGTYAVPRQYRGHVDRVVSALVEREQGLCDEVVAAAAANGVDEDTARDTLSDLGLHVNAAVEDSDVVADLRKQVADLTAFARRNGYRG